MARVLEHGVRRAGLAVRLLDLSTGQPIREGISVTAWHEAHPRDRVVTKAVTARGITGFPRLPRLGAFEDGSTSRDHWFIQPERFAPETFVVRVDDVTHEHLSVLRSVLVPSPAVIDLSLPRSAAAVVPAGSMAVTATILTESLKPAAWAVVELSVGGYTTGGLADDRGVVLVPLPRAVPPTLLGSIATGPVWRLTVQVRYQPAKHVAAPGAAIGDPPTLTSLFVQQPARVLDGSVLVDTIQRDATTDGPLVLASLDPRSPSDLLISPAL